MSEFDNREEAFEKRFAVDEELAFKALARRNKLIGLWLAEQVGLKEAEAKPYAEALVAAQVGAADPNSLFNEIKTRLAKAGVDLSDNRIRRRIEEAGEQARKEIMTGR
jgi:hypothetical protein